MGGMERAVSTRIFLAVAGIFFLAAILLPHGSSERTLAICVVILSLVALAVRLAWDNRAAPSFSLKRMLIAISLVTVGFGALVLPFKSALSDSEVSMALWFCCGPLIGAGFGSLHKNPISGALIGMMVGAILQGFGLWIIVKNRWFV